jgi:hypothetical protein
MILENVKVDVEKSSNFESTEFRIDTKYRNKVLWMLINQYRHKVRTPVQEIVSNARDAQRENGNPDTPIKIQLPTRIEPTFIVRDFGVGMNEERIKTIFTSFGASTKNADNSQTGGFGIGAKSPLAYTDSFNIKTYVDGQYWFYVIAKTENDGIGINLLDTGDTTEENGTEVQIPVNSCDTRDFIESACRSTMFWEVQPVFNLSDEDIYKITGGNKISDTLSVFKNQELCNMFNTKIVVVVDGIPYPVDYELTRSIKEFREVENLVGHSGNAVFFLNTGDIDLLQTRESIEDTDKTRTRLSHLACEAVSDIKVYIESYLTDKSLEGRFKQYIELYNKFSNIKGHSFQVFNFQGNKFYIDNTLNTVIYSYNSKSHSSRKVTTPQRHTNTNRNKGFNEIANFYYDDIKDAESDTIKNRRMRNHLEETGNEPCLITQGRADNLIYVRTLRMLGAKKLSSLELPKKKVSVKGVRNAVVKKPEIITIHETNTGTGRYASQWKSTYDTLVKDVECKYAYVGYNERNSYMLDTRYINLIKKQFNVKVCRLSEKSIRLVKNNTKFVHLNDLMKDFEPSQEIIDNVVNSRIVKTNYDKMLKVIKADSKMITDKLLTKMAQYVNIESEEMFLPRELENEILNDNVKKIKARTLIVQKFDKRIENKYYLATYSDDRKEIVNYINLVNRRK